MTLIIALRCSDGLVIAADSAASDFEVGTRQPTKKIKRLREFRVLYGGSGDVGLIQNIEAGLQAFPPNDLQEYRKLRPAIKRLVCGALTESSELHVPYRTRQPFNEQPFALMLFAGYCNDGYSWILGTDRDGRECRYDEDLGNFAAIGSGSTFAHAIFRPYYGIEIDLEIGKPLAYRILYDSIQLACAGLSEPVQMWVIQQSPETPPTEITEPELRDLGVTRETWKQLELENLGRLTSRIPHTDGPDIPTPDTNAS
jgi:20S proteasome alpha/beta subunit